MKKIFLPALASAALALLLTQNVQAAEKKPRRTVKNDVQIYSTKPDLPADVPYTNTRDRYWLGGYLNDGYHDENFEEEEITTSPRHRDRRERRRWRDRH